eukprot:3820421-Pyramimonas_sp.AAC.1
MQHLEPKYATLRLFALLNTRGDVHLILTLSGSAVDTHVTLKRRRDLPALTVTPLGCGGRNCPLAGKQMVCTVSSWRCAPSTLHSRGRLFYQKRSRLESVRSIRSVLEL